MGELVSALVWSQAVLEVPFLFGSSTETEHEVGCVWAFPFPLPL